MSLASAMNMSGLDAAKPVSGFIAGRVYFATDTKILYYDNGASLDAYPLTSGPAGELAHTEITTATISTTSTTPVDVTGLTVTATLGSRPVALTVHIPQWGHTVGRAVAIVELHDVTGSVRLQLAVLAANSDGNGSAISITKRHAPGAGSRTYKVQFYTVTAGTLTLNSYSDGPSSIGVVEI